MLNGSHVVIKGCTSGAYRTKIVGVERCASREELPIQAEMYTLDAIRWILHKNATRYTACALPCRFIRSTMRACRTEFGVGRRRRRRILLAKTFRHFAFLGRASDEIRIQRRHLYLESRRRFFNPAETSRVTCSAEGRRKSTPHKILNVFTYF